MTFDRGTFKATIALVQAHIESATENVWAGSGIPAEGALLTTSKNIGALTIDMLEDQEGAPASKLPRRRPWWHQDCPRDQLAVMLGSIHGDSSNLAEDLGGRWALKSPVTTAQRIETYSEQAGDIMIMIRHGWITEWPPADASPPESCPKCKQGTVTDDVNRRYCDLLCGWGDGPNHIPYDPEQERQFS